MWGRGWRLWSRVSSPSCQPIQRAANGHTSSVENVCVDDGGLDVLAAEEALRFLLGEDYWQALGAFGAQGIDRSQILVQHLAVEEQRGAEGLILGRGVDVLPHRQVGERGFDFRRAHFVGMALAVEEDVARDPGDVGLFRAVGVVFQAQGVAHLVQKSLGCWLWFHGRFPSFD